MKRIVIHWTAGSHKASDLDRSHYHFIVEGDGRVIEGFHRVEDNAGPLKPGKYAAHTRSLNTGSIGVSLAAMAGAKERPFSAGRYPITEKQVEALAQLCASLCRSHKIEVTRETVLTHAEVQRTLGVTQAGKWDITWLPGMSAPRDPVAVGDILRDRIREAIRPPSRPAPVPEPPQPASSGLFDALAKLIAAIFGGKK